MLLEIDFLKEDYNNFLHYLSKNNVMLSNIGDNLYLSMNDNKDNKYELLLNVDGVNVDWVVENNVIEHLENIFFKEFKEYSDLWINYSKIKKSFFLEYGNIVFTNDVNLENIGEPYHIEYLKQILEKIELDNSPKLLTEKYNLNFKELLFLHIWSKEKLLNNDLQEWKDIYIDWLDSLEDCNENDLSILTILQYHNLPSLLVADDDICKRLEKRNNEKIIYPKNIIKDILKVKSIVEESDDFYNVKFEFYIDGLKDYFSPKIYKLLIRNAFLVASKNNIMESVNIELNPIVKILSQISEIVEIEIYNQKNNNDFKLSELEERKDWWLWMKVSKKKFDNNFINNFQNNLKKIAPFINNFINTEDLINYIREDSIKNKLDELFLCEKISLSEKKSKKIKY